jgi:two-component system, NtrC family, sensor kinase
MTDSELDRLVNTVRHMLDFYRPGQREKEIVSLTGAIDRVLHLLKSQLDHQGIICELTIPEGFPSVYAVRDQVQQVFFNLILNSMDAMEPMTSGKYLWIESLVSDGRVCIYIEDSGTGIPDDMEVKLFEPFVSTKKNGTGLGLAVSYGIVEAHGGQLKLAKPLHGSGARFEVQFPYQKVN